jgi:hypothetical protein
MNCRKSSYNVSVIVTNKIGRDDTPPPEGRGGSGGEGDIIGY